MGKKARRRHYNVSKRRDVKRVNNYRQQALNIGNEYRKRITRNEKALTRDVFIIAKPDLGLSSAEDLRIKHPFEVDSQGRKYRQVNGALASAEYKSEPVKKKTILLLGVTSIVLLILIVLLFAGVDIHADRCFSLIKLW